MSAKTRKEGSERRGPDEPKRAEALGPVTVHARVGPSLSCAGAQRQAVHTLHTHLRLGNSRVCAPSRPRADASRWAGRRWTPERHIAEHGHMHVTPASWGGAPSVYRSRTVPCGGQYSFANPHHPIQNIFRIHFPATSNHLEGGCCLHLSVWVESWRILDKLPHPQSVLSLS